MHAHHGTTLPLLIVLSLTATSGLQAQEWRGQDGPEAHERMAWRREQHSVQSGMSLDQAAQMAQRRFNARVVKAETVRSGDRRVHQIRLLNAEGKVFTVRVDAETGQMF